MWSGVNDFRWGGGVTGGRRTKVQVSSTGDPSEGNYEFTPVTDPPIREHRTYRGSDLRIQGVVIPETETNVIYESRIPSGEWSTRKLSINRSLPYSPTYLLTYLQSVTRFVKHV